MGGVGVVVEASETELLKERINLLEAERAKLLQQQSALKHVVSSIPYFVFWKDAAGHYLGCNERFAQAGGFERPEQVVGLTDYDMPWSKEESDAYRAIDHRVMDSGEILEVEETQVDATGRKTIVFTSKVPLRDVAGDVIGILGIYTDITAQKQLELELKAAKETAEAASQAKSDFLAAVSHELRTPLALVLGPLDLLRAKNDLAADVKDVLAGIHRNGWRLKNLMDDVLDTVKADAGMTVVYRENTDVSALVERLVAEARPAAEARAISLQLELDATGDVAVDRRMFERMTLNYIGNALKFTPTDGSITVKLAATESEIRLAVTDTGIGISEENQSRLFRRFQQADPTMTRRFGGTGLGLALVKEYAGLMDGSVNVASELGKGSTFSFSLPRIEAEPSSSAASTVLGTSLHEQAGLAARFDQGSIAPEPLTSETGPCVVLAEDNAELRAHISKVLVGYRVIGCRNGALALTAIRRHRPDVVVTDVMMPEMNGEQLIAAVKADPSIAHTPMIVLTAFSSRRHVAGTLESGADDFLEKPFSPEELVARVRVAIRLHDARKELVAKNDELLSTMSRIVEMEKLAALGRMLTQIAHEINNPMVAVVGNIEPLEQYMTSMFAILDAYTAAPILAGPYGDRLRERAKELDIDFVREDFFTCLECVREGVERVRSIQRDLRSFLRGNVDEAANVEVDVNEGLRATVDMLKRALPPGVKVGLELGPLPLVSLKLGPLKQVFLNLLQNASDAMDGRGAIDVTSSFDGQQIVVTVTDDGPGIRQEVRSNIFEPFFTTKGVGQGSGLGLAVCRQIINAHGGDVRLDESSQRTRFVVTLPVAERRVA